ncbi:hypothetical protein Bbelb_397410 [Branchiostoma belcheri]|nr:hypothetical protein Bbelb_397410 [Branchiostoma belcheri]
MNVDRRCLFLVSLELTSPREGGNQFLNVFDLMSPLAKLWQMSRRRTSNVGRSSLLHASSCELAVNGHAYLSPTLPTPSRLHASFMSSRAAHNNTVSPHQRHAVTLRARPNTRRTTPCLQKRRLQLFMCLP